MGPKPTLPNSGDLYRSRLDQILDPRHELFRLAGLIDGTASITSLAASIVRSGDLRSRRG